MLNNRGKAMNGRVTVNCLDVEISCVHICPTASGGGIKLPEPAIFY